MYRKLALLSLLLFAVSFQAHEPKRSWMPPKTKDKLNFAAIGLGYGSIASAVTYGANSLFRQRPGLARATALPIVFIVSFIGVNQTTFFVLDKYRKFTEK